MTDPDIVHRIKDNLCHWEGAAFFDDRLHETVHLLNESKDEIKRLRHELTEAKKAILNLTVGTGTDIMHERQDADSSNAEFRRNYR